MLEGIFFFFFFLAEGFDEWQVWYGILVNVKRDFLCASL